MSNCDQIIINDSTTNDYIVINDNIIKDNVDVVAEGSLVTSVNSRIGAIVLSKFDVGLDQIDNTSDLNKPISNATLSALLLKTDLSAFNTLNNIVTSNYGSWNNVYLTVNGLSGNWQDSYSLLNSISSIIQTPSVFFDTTSEILTINNSSTSLISLGYENIYANSSLETIQDFAASNPQNLYKGYNVTLLNNRVYTFAGTDSTNPSHYLEINANPFTPIYQEIALNQNQTLIDMFYLGDFKTAKYTLQVETNFNNDIYYSELNVVGSVQSQNAVVSEYGQISTSDLILGYSVSVNANYLYLYLNHSMDTDINHKFLVKGLRTNHYRI
jgi:hypothetical protein